MPVDETTCAYNVVHVYEKVLTDHDKTAHQTYEKVQTYEKAPVFDLEKAQVHIMRPQLHEGVHSTQIYEKAQTYEKVQTYEKFQTYEKAPMFDLEKAQAQSQLYEGIQTYEVAQTYETLPKTAHKLQLQHLVYGTDV